MEAVAWLAGEPHSDTPQCACPIIAEFIRSWNDTLDDADRQKLKRYLPKLLNTKSTFGVEQKRGLLAADWYIRVYTPTWLTLGNLQEHADKLRALPEITNWSNVTNAETLLSAARSAARSAAEQALAGTTERLQKSAFELLEKMIEVTA